MQCSFCNYIFDEEEGAQVCMKCAAFGGCRMVKCPRCGYEMPQTPSIVKTLREWGKRKFGSRTNAVGR